MSTDRDLKAHAKLVAKDLKAGKATANTDRAMEFMGENPDAVLGAIGLIPTSIQSQEAQSGFDRGLRLHVHQWARNDPAIRPSGGRIGRKI